MQALLRLVSLLVFQPQPSFHPDPPKLGGDESIQGLARLVMCVCEVPFFWYARQILDRLGIYGSLVLTFAGYTVRFIIYRCGRGKDAQN